MKYLYCIINKAIRSNFGEIGINKSKVFSLPYKNISLIMHDCNVDELKNKNKNDLLIEHEYVVDFAMKKFNAIIPFFACSLIEEKKIRPFLEKKYIQFKKLLEKLQGKVQFGVQIFYEEEKLKNEESVESFVLKLRKKKQMMEKYKKVFYDRIAIVVDEIKIENSNNEILFSCLLDRSKIAQFKAELQKMQKEFSIILSGPWPPYSFACRMKNS